jgi:hypothetical protein
LRSRGVPGTADTNGVLDGGRLDHHRTRAMDRFQLYAASMQLSGSPIMSTWLRSNRCGDVERVKLGRAGLPGTDSAAAAGSDNAV